MKTFPSPTYHFGLAQGKSPETTIRPGIFGPTRVIRLKRSYKSVSGLRKRSRLCEKPPERPPCLLEVEWGTEAPVHQQGARHDVDARRQSRGLPGLRFEGAVHEYQLSAHWTVRG